MQKDKYQNYMKSLNKINRVAKLEHYQQKCKDYKQNTKKLMNRINKKTVDKTTLIPLNKKRKYHLLNWERSKQCTSEALCFNRKKLCRKNK